MEISSILGKESWSLLTDHIKHFGVGKDGLTYVISVGLAIYTHPSDVYKEDLDNVVITTVPFMLGTAAVFPFLILKKDYTYSKEPEHATKALAQRLSIRTIGDMHETKVDLVDLVEFELSKSFTRCWRTLFKMSMDAFIQEVKNV